MDELMTGSAAQEAEEQEESLILKFRKPYQFEGQEYTEVDLSGLEDVTAADLCAAGRAMTKKGTVSPMPEMTMEYAVFMAARVSGKPLEFFNGLPGREAIRLKTLVTGFLYGGDGED